MTGPQKRTLSLEELREREVAATSRAAQRLQRRDVDMRGCPFDLEPYTPARYPHVDADLLQQAEWLRRWNVDAWRRARIVRDTDA